MSYIYGCEIVSLEYCHVCFSWCAREELSRPSASILVYLSFFIVLCIYSRDPDPHRWNCTKSSIIMENDVKYSVDFWDQLFQTVTNAIDTQTYWIRRGDNSGEWLRRTPGLTWPGMAIASANSLDIDSHWASEFQHIWTIAIDRASRLIVMDQ
jgi:hypothetical protein